MKKLNNIKQGHCILALAIGSLIIILSCCCNLLPKCTKNNTNLFIWNRKYILWNQKCKLKLEKIAFVWLTE